MKLGIIGGGQLGRMLAESAKKIGVEPLIIDESAKSSASHVVNVNCCLFSNTEKIKSIFKEVDVVTYEFENIPVALLKELSKYKKVYPPIEALEVSCHRVKEKTFASTLGIKTPKFIVANNSEDLISKKNTISFPVVIKTCTEGYDGKGQWRFNSLQEFEEKGIGKVGSQFIAEEKIEFDLEFSIIATRDLKDNIKVYPACFNIHDKGILAYTLAPSSLIKSSIYDKAKFSTEKILRELSYVGTIAVEYFLKDDEIYFNEFAPRVHNSGHWTIEGAVTSQFENHVRACMGLELGSSEQSCFSLMVNLLGTKGEEQELKKIKNCFYHWYDKSDLGSRRKVGHVTALYDSEEVRSQNINTVTRLCGFSF